VRTKARDAHATETKNRKQTEGVNKSTSYMVHRRGRDTGIETKIGCHTFRATGITDYLTNGGLSRSHRRWPVTPTPRPQACMTGAMMTSASAKSSGLGFNNSPGPYLELLPHQVVEPMQVPDVID
jgi:hypothetical protein